MSASTTEPTSWDVTWRDEVWRESDDGALEARIFEPTGPGAPSANRPVVVEVHGGAWCINDRRAGTRYNKGLAAAGIVVVAIDFRMGPDHQHPTASQDVAAAVAWTRAHALQLGIDAEKVALVGSSSGGHLALLSALTLDPPVVGVVALWPPLDPLTRYRYALAKGDDHGRGLASSTEKYFGSPGAMEQASVPRVVAAGEQTNLPPVWLVHPSEDLNVPRAITDATDLAYRGAGGDIDIWTVPGEPHAFGHTDGDAADELIVRMRDVLNRWYQLI